MKLVVKTICSDVSDELEMEIKYLNIIHTLDSSKDFLEIW
jgi:hypothetical protein